MRRTVLVAATAGILTAGFTGTAFAGFYDDRLSAPEGACFTRTYGEDHLAKHPRQKTAFIVIGRMERNGDGRGNAAEDFQLFVGVRVKGAGELYTQRAYCKETADGSGARCFIESDGGTLSLKSGDGGKLRAATGERGISFEGEKDFLELGGDASDDSLFLLEANDMKVCRDLDPNASLAPP